MEKNTLRSKRRWHITELGEGTPCLREALVEHFVGVFDNATQYGQKRIECEVGEASPPHRKAFFLAMEAEKILGAAGVKSADWASNTWILYLSAVKPEARGQGIGRQLIEARILWVKAQQSHGRVLVSTGKPQRYRALGFRKITREERSGKHLLVLEF